MGGQDDLPNGLRQTTAFAWTPERIERLKVRWSQGMSAGQISRELGGGISRSAVLGKIHRLGIAAWSPRGGAARTRNEAGKVQRRRKRLPRSFPECSAGGAYSRERRSVPTWVIEAKPYIDNPRLDADIPLSQRRSLLELDAHTCRWPIGEPGGSDFRFCGAAPRPGRPYCAAHCVRAHRPAEETIVRIPNARRRAFAFG